MELQLLDARTLRAKTKQIEIFSYYSQQNAKQYLENNSKLSLEKHPSI